MAMLGWRVGREIPRRTCPAQRPIPQGRDRIWVASRRCRVPQLRVIRPLQGRGTNVAHSGGVAPGYYLVPLQGTEHLPFDLNLRHPFLTSRIAVLGHPCSGRQGLRVTFIRTYSFSRPTFPSVAAATQGPRVRLFDNIRLSMIKLDGAGALRSSRDGRRNAPETAMAGTELADSRL